MYMYSETGAELVKHEDEACEKKREREERDGFRVRSERLRVRKYSDGRWV